MNLDPMTDEQIRMNKRIAEFLGWTELRWHPVFDVVRGISPDEGGIRTPVEVPDYSGDLNAMFEAEKALDASEMEEYAEFLGIKDVIYGYMAVHCSPKDRANAFIRLITEGKSQL